MHDPKYFFKSVVKIFISYPSQVSLIGLIKEACQLVPHILKDGSIHMTHEHAEI